MKLIILTAILFLSAYLTPSLTEAVASMESGSYKIRWPNLNMTSGSKSSANYNIMDTIGQTAPGEYDSTGYKVRAGFPYIKSIIAFSFTISDLSIDFGTLIPGVFSTQTNTLTVSAGGAGGYNVTARANHPLKGTTNDNTIPDTTCNSGTCSETSAGVWDNTTHYGFGYNMSGNDVPAAFINSTYFKQFADASLAESAVTVMSKIGAGANRIATVTYKVIVSQIQPAGSYENSITYVATPSF
jgi:hypothetical protein